MTKQHKKVSQFTLINNGIMQNKQFLTVSMLERLLFKKEYAAIQRLDYDTKAERKAAATVERVTGFGNHMANAFETQCALLDSIPTQKQFDQYCLQLAEQFWSEAMPEGTAWNSGIAKAVTNRNYRCWLAQINELHCSLLLQELFPRWNVYNSNDIDLLMGVDLIVETEKKRLYLHIFKDSQYSFIAFRKKEQRGGRKDQNGKFHRFQRDFTGDKALMYAAMDVETESTKFINGIPLFKANWLENQMELFNHFDQFGEPLEDTAKLQHLEDYLAELASVEQEVEV